MALFDEEEMRKEKERDRKIKTIVKVGIIISTIVTIALMIGIYYLIQNFYHLIHIVNYNNRI